MWASGFGVEAFGNMVFGVGSRVECLDFMF